MSENGNRPHEYVGAKSKISRQIIFWILRYLFGQILVALKFDGESVRKLNELEVDVVIAPPTLFRILLLMRDPSFHLPEAFVKGHWYVSKGSLADFVVHLHNRRGTKPSNRGIFGGVVRSFLHVRKQYASPLLTRQVKTHYNSDSNLFELILGPSMVYSCAFFDEINVTLEQAQENKLHITLQRLAMKEGASLKLLDIGCGWGSFARHAGQRPGLHIDGISIALSQIEYATDLLKHVKVGKNSTANFIVADYQDYEPGGGGLYDHIVSIGMLEHVGKLQYRDFFSSVSRLLVTNGTAVIHSIVRRDSGRMNPWIDKYIFPGGFVPRGSEVLKGIEDSGLHVKATYFHSGLNYKSTLGIWLRNLEDNREAALEILAGNVDEIARSQNRNLSAEKRRYLSECAFRKWKFYLAGIQIVFDHAGGNFELCQFVLSKSDRKYW